MRGEERKRLGERRVGIDKRIEHSFHFSVVTLNSRGNRLKQLGLRLEGGKGNLKGGGR